MGQDKDCIFCKIIKDEVPSLKVYEDKNILAFLDIAPANAGHTLVITKEHFDAFADLPNEAIIDLMIKIKNFAPKIAKAVGAEAFNIGINNGKTAGQIISHAHIHIIPRFEKDGLKHWPGRKYEEKVMNALAEKIRKEMEKY